MISLNCSALSFPSFASRSQEIGDFLGVTLQVQQNEVYFASLKQTNLQVKIRSCAQED